MRLPNPKKLPSGQWFIQVMVDGTRKSRAFDTKDEALYWASGLKTKSIMDARGPRQLSVGDAVDRYIETKTVVLSPSTIAGYKKIRSNLMGDIEQCQLHDLTQDNVQRWVNHMVKDGKSPKTIANAHGLLSAVLDRYYPDFRLKTTLPRKVKPDIQIPTEAEAKAIMKAAAGTKYELPISMAIWLGLRQSEILGLRWEDIDSDTLHVRHAIVMGEDGPTEKGTKTFSGVRDLHIPAHIKSLLDAADRKGDHVINLSGKAIYSGFSRICEKAGVPHFRFHDLRHANASLMLAVGIPDKYSMKRMGHATNNMLKTTYQHTIKEKEIEYNTKLENYLDELFGQK